MSIRIEPILKHVHRETSRCKMPTWTVPSVRTAMAKLFQLGRLSSKQVRLDKVHRTSLYQFLNTRGLNMIPCIRGAVYFHYIQCFHIFSSRAARKMLLNNLTYFWGHKKASSSKLQAPEGSQKQQLMLPRIGKTGHGTKIISQLKQMFLVSFMHEFSMIFCSKSTCHSVFSPTPEQLLSKNGQLS